MEEKKLFRDRQEVGPDDLDSMQEGIRRSFDHIVSSAVSDELRFVDFEVTKESATSIRIGTGLLFNEGRVYTAPADVVIPLTTRLPLLHARVIAVYVSPNSIDTQLEDRTFVTDTSVYPPQGIPQQVPMTNLRFADPGISAGVPSTDPQMPAVPGGSCLVATFLLGTAGVIDGSIVKAFENGLPNLEDHAAKLAEFAVWRAAAGSKIDALTSESAALYARTLGKADAQDQFQLMVDVARLKKLADLPTVNAPYDADNFRTSQKIDQAVSPVTTWYKLSKSFPSALFPNAAGGTSNLALFNPSDDAVYKSPGSLILPKFTPVVAVEVAGYSGEVNMSQYSLTTTVTKQFTGYTTETRYGY